MVFDLIYFLSEAKKRVRAERGLYFLSEAKKRVRAERGLYFLSEAKKRGLYFLLKLKRKVEFFPKTVSGTKPWADVLDRCSVLIQRARRIVSAGRILRGGALVFLLVLFLTFSLGRAIPADNEGGKPLDLRPALRADASFPPKISAKSSYLVDLKSGFVFYDKNSLLKLPPASTTKLATALVALEDYKLDEVVVVHPSCVLRTGESIMGLYAGEKITVRNLLQGMLIASAGDAACALATHHPEGMLEFIAEMNALVASLGLEHTYFVNPTGMDSTHQYSTAQELTLLAEGALKSSFIRKVVAIEETSVTSVDGRSWHYLKSTNKLFGVMLGISGVKTGYTVKAKEVFIFLFRKEGKEILGAVMGSEDRFADAETLLKWVLTSFAFPYYRAQAR